MTAGKYDFILEQGSVYTQNFLYTDENDSPIDLTGYTGRMMIRATYDATSPLLTLQTSDGSLVLGDSSGTITANANATTTAALAFETAVYDIELYPAGDEAQAVKILYGSVSLRLEATK